MIDYEKNLIDAIQRVAEAAREVSDTAEDEGCEDCFVVNGEEMRTLRENLKGWTTASNALLEAVSRGEPIK